MDNDFDYMRHVALHKAMQFYDIKNTNVKPEQVVQVAEIFFNFLSGKES